MKKIKNIDILNFMNMQGVDGKRWPIRMMNAIALNVEACGPAIKAFEKTRMQLINQYSQKDGEGNPVIVDNRYIFEDQAGWTNAITELHETEVEVPITTISMDEVVKCEGSDFDSLVYAELKLLKFMIEA